MARPKSSGLYPEDDEILDRIELDLSDKKYRSKTAAIRARIDEIPGTGSDESKVRRMLRGLQNRERDQSDFIDGLTQLLKGKSTAEKAATVERIARSTAEQNQRIMFALGRLRTSTAPVTEEMIQAFLKAEIQEIYEDSREEPAD